MLWKRHLSLRGRPLTRRRSLITRDRDLHHGTGTAPRFGTHPRQRDEYSNDVSDLAAQVKYSKESRVAFLPAIAEGDIRWRSPCIEELAPQEFPYRIVTASSTTIRSRKYLTTTLHVSPGWCQMNNNAGSRAAVNYLDQTSESLVYLWE
ncbi:hypothetical protein EVAR_95705_1 [Eumeta japonica]|uniref:Uncharacterized protein n=1 Tax=Eumeta variegata TaxID=151549 RepID=A0A4C1VME9_EUMVA|nr:hypothetical protein EVAR_95705_1 [Eumeta japonica]